MQADLQAFLEHRVTLAEKERRGWSPNATLEAAREALRRASRTVGRAPAARWIKVRARGAAASFLGGMVLWIGGTFGWKALQASHAPAPVATVTPVKAAAPASAAPKIDLPRLYAEEGERILNSYSASQDNSLDDFDWQKAELCLARAVQSGASGDALSGELALSRGYAILERLSGARYSAEARLQQRTAARSQFEAAARELLQNPQPHLALARLSAYQEGSPERAMAEFAAAEKLGAVPGRREIEQQADAWRLRAERTWSWQDAQTARALYQRIPGFDQADRHVKELDRIHRPVRRRTQYVRRSRWR